VALDGIVEHEFGYFLHGFGILVGRTGMGGLVGIMVGFMDSFIFIELGRSRSSEFW
jgi:hypothetical protein